MIVCVVCQTSSSLPSNVSFKEISSEKSKHSNTILALKLFACLRLQLLSGYLCSVCHHLIDEIDGFETQIKSLKDVLTSRLHSKHVSNDLEIDLSAILDEERDICSNEEDLKETEGEDGSGTGLGKQSKQSPTEFWNNANNPEALKRYVDSGRVDTCFTLTTTQRGEDLLMYQGYAYRKKSPKPIFLDENATSGLWKWRCSKHATKKDNCCRAQIATIDNLFVLKDSLCYTHSHLPDFKSTKKQLIRERIREIATNHPTMKTIEILKNAEMLITETSGGGGSNTSSRLRDDRSLHRYIQRIRAKEQQY